MSVAVEFRNINKAYGENVMIEDLNLKIEKGEFVSIVGSSGCGKTTTLKMVNGLIEPTSGSVWVNNEDIKTQGSVLFTHLNVEQNISYVPNLLNKKDKTKTRDAVSKWMQIVGLDEDIMHRYPNELSGGQQQRVGIARALAASPSILLMDEPFGAVDEITREQLQKEMKRIHNETKITILFVTHDMNEALKLGTKVMVMNQGKIEQYDTPKNILNHPASDYVNQLVYRQRHMCHLSDDQLGDCEYSSVSKV